MDEDDLLPAVSGEALSRGLSMLRAEANGFAEDLGLATKQLREMDAESRRLARSLSSSLRSAFDKAVFGGAALGDVLKGLASDVAGRALDSALRPVHEAIGTGVSGAVGALTGAITRGFGFADGAAFSGGRVRAFAQGGVVRGPTTFPMRGGLGLMGEAGPEAIMPLSRGADGQLGVRMQGAAASNVTINIQTPDVEGFRRSRGQIAAQIARVAGAGGRRL
ncbi:MAG: phage tail tape measure protein [Pseudomonadota bacterium]